LYWIDTVPNTRFSQGRNHNQNVATEITFFAFAIWADWARDLRINLAEFAQTASFTSIASLKPCHLPNLAEDEHG
jgi:hypothetical protein